MTGALDSSTEVFLHGLGAEVPKDYLPARFTAILAGVT